MHIMYTLSDINIKNHNKMQNILVHRIYPYNLIKLAEIRVCMTMHIKLNYNNKELY